jgi:sugar lactone lactonase YvrE
MKNLKLILVTLFAMMQMVNGQIITTIAGDSVAGYNNDGILAINAELNAPASVAIDRAGNVYIADGGNNRVRKIDIFTGIIATIAGTGTAGYNGDGIAATSAELNFPHSIALDDSSNIYIADALNERIRKITISTGMISTIAGTGTSGYNGDGIAATTAKLNYPCAVALDGSGNIYIAEKINRRIRKVTIGTGVISTIADSTTVIPEGVAIDASGNVYISDSWHERIFKIIISTGDTSTIAQTPNVSGPRELIVDASGNVYYANGGGGTVRKIAIGTGVNSIIAGTGTGAYNGDGIPATFANIAPAGVALDTAGNVYIADAGNNRIRKITMNTGIPDVNNSLNTILVYPNPNNGNFTVSYSLSSKNSKLQIMDLTGRIVFTHNMYSMEGKETIDVSYLNNGIYFYTIINEKEVLKGRFIKE